MQQAEPTSSADVDVVPEQPPEVTHVPLWVKAIIVIGLVLFAIQIPGFMGSLSDAVQKSRAVEAYDHGQFEQAIKSYESLHGHYPKDSDLTRCLGFSYYHAGRYVDAMNTFKLLDGVKMSKTEIREINHAVSDIVEKLKLKTR